MKCLYCGCELMFVGLDGRLVKYGRKVIRCKKYPNSKYFAIEGWSHICNKQKITKDRVLHLYNNVKGNEEKRLLRRGSISRRMC